MLFFNRFFSCSWGSFLPPLSMCIYVCMCVCVCVCLCVSIVILMPFRQLVYRVFQTEIFATNWSQIWVFSEDLIKYISSLKSCNTTYQNEIEDHNKKEIWLSFANQMFLKTNWIGRNTDFARNMALVILGIERQTLAQTLIVLSFRRVVVKWKIVWDCYWRV